jgi:Ca-activated chloride channel family protein
MTVPVLGEMSASGFQHPWLFLFVLVPLAVATLYLAVRARQRRRMQRFADPDLADSVSRGRPSRWRHVPIALMVVALLLLTLVMAGPTRAARIPRNRAVILLAIDCSQSMRSSDVSPSRLDAAREQAKAFARQLTPGINLGLIAFAGTANVLVSPTPDHDATVAALDNVKPADSTAIGEAIFAGLDSIATVAAVLGAGDPTPPPTRMVLLSDGKENKPGNPDNPKGAYTAARAAKDRGVPIWTIAFGTPEGSVDVNGQRVPVPVDDSMMKKIAQLSGGKTYSASTASELATTYRAVQQSVGFQVVQRPATSGWLRLGVLAATIACVIAVVVNRRLPT